MHLGEFAMVNICQAVPGSKVEDIFGRKKIAICQNVQTLSGFNIVQQYGHWTE